MLVPFNITLLFDCSGDKSRLEHFVLENKLTQDDIAVWKNFEQVVQEKFSNRVFSTLTPDFIYNGKDYKVESFANDIGLLSSGWTYSCQDYVGIFMNEIIGTNNVLVFYQFAESQNNERILRYKAV